MVQTGYFSCKVNIQTLATIQTTKQQTIYQKVTQLKKNPSDVPIAALEVIQQFLYQAW